MKPGKKKTSSEFVERELLVRFRTDVRKEKKNAVHAKLQSRVLHSYRMLDGLDHVEIPAGNTLEGMITAYTADPDVLYAEPNYVYHMTAIPDDDFFGELWGLNNTGQDGGTPDADINAPEAWDHVTGSPDTVVAVVDTGVDYDHLDLRANIWVNPGEIPGNAIDDDGNGYIDDIHGINAITGTGDPMDDDNHGTHVAGTIAASGNDHDGVVGVNWRAAIVACKFLDNTGRGTSDNAIECLDYLSGLKTRPDNPVNIILSNNSWGGAGNSQALQDAIDAHRQNGILFIAAAGNESEDGDTFPSYPAGYNLPNVISVAATDHEDTLAAFSNFGRHSVHVAAPGVYIVSTAPGNIWKSMDGTSMAAPHVSGLAALTFSQDPARDWIGLKNLVISGGQDKPATAGTTISGKRIRAFDTNGVGSLSCAQQVVYSRLQPKTSYLFRDVGSVVELSALHINCAAPNGDVVVTLGDGTPIILMDDGQGPDAAAGDGIYSGQWLPPAEGTYSITFPDTDIITVHVEKEYSYEPPIEIDYSYRSITGTELVFFPEPPELPAFIQSPFPISLLSAQTTYSDLYVSPYGTISFTDHFSSPENTFLPAFPLQTLVAPFWSPLNPSVGDGVFWEVIGAEPHRELVVEWRNVTHSACAGSATFQVVFFENSPEIQYNYQDVMFDHGCLSGNVTVGLQWQSGFVNYFQDVRSFMSLLWSKPITVVASAGSDQVALPGTTVSLDGTGSLNNDGAPISYLWEQTAGLPVALSGADTANPQFVAPNTTDTLTFRITVTNNTGQTASDSVTVFVNMQPVADAGPDQSVAANAVVTVDGTNSFDPDGSVFYYYWSQTAGPPVLLSNAYTPKPHFTAPSVSGVMTFNLTVTDNNGATASDTVNVSVNLPPTANAGPDQMVLAGAAVTLNGAASSDPDGTIAGYSWSQTAGTTVTLTGATTAAPSFTAPNVSGALSFLLTVTDNNGATASDTVNVSVNLPPTANAGPDQMVLAGAAVTLNGAASSDPDGTIAGYSWSQT
ncbi:MAG TPA: S8 family serine peptidase, partial [Candidatus Methanoperedens sp.]|nr:S8 family serine peptidase [Candidatus Methanoperedens sp.]